MQRQSSANVDISLRSAREQLMQHKAQERAKGKGCISVMIPYILILSHTDTHTMLVHRGNYMSSLKHESVERPALTYGVNLVQKWRAFQQHMALKTGKRCQTILFTRWSVKRHVFWKWKGFTLKNGLRMRYVLCPCNCFIVQYTMACQDQLIFYAIFSVTFCLFLVVPLV